jgi:hypothetical protein
MCAHPPVPLNTDTAPPAPIFTVAAFAITCPAEKFKLDAVGRVTPAGNTVKNPDDGGATAVTFNTAPAASTGTPPTPVTWKFRDVFAGTHPPVLRVSPERAGVIPTNPPAPTAPPA